MVSWWRRTWDYFTKFPTPEEKVLAAREASPKAWASFEIDGFEPDGRVAIKMKWNPAFITHLKSLGFEAETEEDTVQLFFYASSMRPTHLASDPQDDAVQSAAHPGLSTIVNEIRT
jgi:hypothetical protein